MRHATWKKENHGGRGLVSCLLSLVARRGFTLVEIIVYIGVFALVSVFLIRTLLVVHAAYRKLQSERDVASAARSAMTALSREIREAKSVYTPTSILNDPHGQVSLETSVAPVSAEAKNFADFYLDNGRLYVKREGAASFPLTSEAVEVQEFNVARLVFEGRESVRVTIRIVSRMPGQFIASSTLATSFTPRGNY
ncbi:MAG: hypothetical protein HY471_00335 [Candidatus Sungbacteria bacterium]|nr:hypothetical protein [Candidatus Sungbacteria bacterium]